MDYKNKKFWIAIDIHEGTNDDTAEDLKEILRIIRMDFAGDTQSVLAEKVGLKPVSIRNYEEIKGKPYVGLSLIKKLCNAYGLKCELKIYNNEN